MRSLFISTMKNEGPYILEWLAYHQSIGFDDFLIYTNDCEDGTELMLDRLASQGHLIHVRNEVLRRGPHKSALKYAKDHPAYASADWVFVGDADEFVNIRTGEGRVADLIATAPEADAIPVTWRLFSYNGHVPVTPDILSSFTDAQSDAPQPAQVARFVKTLFRPSAKVLRIGLHAPVYEDDAAPVFASPWCRAVPDGDPLRPAEAFGYEIAQVNHYAVRSVGAYLVKRARGRANHVNETLGINYWRRWNVGGSEDRSILRHADAVAERLAALKADPIVAALHHAAIEWHERKVSELLKDPEVAELNAEILALVGSKPNEPKPESLAIKAPKRHANRLAMLDKMPKGGVAAEIGVWNGAFSYAILEVTRPKELTLIDPWDMLAGQPQETWTHERHEDARAMGAMHAAVAARFEGNPAVSIRKGFSAEVMETFPDNHFDWVYIDGNHLYEFVRRDLEIAFDKVRPGGCIAGDDFFWKREGRMHVREAVFDVLRERGLEGIHERMGQQFMIWLPR